MAMAIAHPPDTRVPPNNSLLCDSICGFSRIIYEALSAPDATAPDPGSSALSGSANRAPQYDSEWHPPWST